MTSVLTGFVVAFVAGLIGTRLTIPLAKKLGIVDKPDDYRKVHRCVMPLLGGLPIFVAAFLPVTLLGLIDPNHAVIQGFQEGRSCLVALMLGSLMAFGLGAIDDVMEMRARWKLLLQIVAAVAAFTFGLQISAVTVPFIGSVALGWLALPTTVLWFLACMNAINLIDGLDGLAAGVSLFVLLTMALVALLQDQLVSLFLLTCASGAICGFLFFNFHPAKIFLGDSGSMLLGFLVAALSLFNTAKAETTVALLIPIVAMGVPVTDTAMAILRRWSKGLPLSAPEDRRHLHHRLLSYGLSHPRAVLLIYGICVMFGLASVLIATGGDETIVFVLAVLGIIAVISMRIIGDIRFADPFHRLTQELALRTCSKDARIAVERAAHRLPECESLQEIWSELDNVFHKLGVDQAHMQVNGETEAVFTWSSKENIEVDLHSMVPGTWTACMELHADGRDGGIMLVRHKLEGSPHPPELSRLLRRLRHMTADAVRRVCIPEPVTTAHESQPEQIQRETES